MLWLKISYHHGFFKSNLPLNPFISYLVLPQLKLACLYYNFSVRKTESHPIIIETFKTNDEVVILFSHAVVYCPSGAAAV